MGGTAIGGGMLLQGLTGLFGAQSQSNTNNANLQAMINQQNYMRGLVGQYLTPAGQQNPYSQAMSQFVGQSQQTTPQQQQQQQQTQQQQQQAMNGSVAHGPPASGPIARTGTSGASFDMAPQGPIPQLLQSVQSGGGVTDQGGQGFPGLAGIGNMMGPGIFPGTGMIGQEGAPGYNPNGPSGGFTPQAPIFNPQSLAGGGRLDPNGPPQQQPTLGGQMFIYQDPGAFTYNPQGLGAAPTFNAPQGQAGQVAMPQQAGIGQLFQPQQVGGLPNVSAQQIGGLPQLNAPQVSGLPQLNASSINGLPSVQAQQIGGLPQLQAQNVNPMNTQAYNTGQDSLMQMLTKQITPASDPTMNLNLQQLGSGQDLFNLSPLFKSIEDQGQMNLDKQVSALRAGAGAQGGLGARFGTGEQIAEGQLRSNFLTNMNAQEQQTGLQAFQQAQQLRQPALDLQANQLNQQNQLGLANQQNQLQTASTLASLGQQGNQLGLQAQLANQQSGLAAQQGNLNAALGVATANQGAGLQAGSTNLQALLQAALANQQTGLSAQQGNLNAALNSGIANQGAGLSAQQGNLNAALQSAQYNQGANLQAGTTNLQAMLQAALANQQSGLTAGMGGQSLLAQLSQFNAQQGLQAGSLNAQLQNQMGTANLNSMLQAALANQGVMSQYGIDNANIQNQAGQFNAQMRQTGNQFAANQGQQYNQSILAALNQAGGMQQGYQGLNNSLIGLLNGVGVPQAQPSPWPSAIGNAGSIAAMIPFLNQLYSGGGGGGGGGGNQPVQGQSIWG